MKFEQIEPFLPYIASIVTSIIAGLLSYFTSRKAAKEDIAKLEKQHELDIDTERKKFVMEKEKLELEHKHQLEILQKQQENSMGSSMMNTLLTEAMKMPEVRQQLSQGIRNGSKKKRN